VNFTELEQFKKYRLKDIINRDIASLLYYGFDLDLLSRRWYNKKRDKKIKKHNPI
jgi:hypothetical protein